MSRINVFDLVPGSLMFEIDTDVNSNAVLTEYIYRMVKHLPWFSRGIDSVIVLFDCTSIKPREYSRDEVIMARSND